MRLETSRTDDGFNVWIDDPSDRTRFVTWKAFVGDTVDGGMIDMSGVRAKAVVHVPIGDKPDRVIVSPVRDQTPGAYQSQCSHVQGGACIIDMYSSTGIEGRICLFISATGNAMDAREVGIVPNCRPGNNVTINASNRGPWTRLIVKRMDDEAREIALSRIVVRTMNERFEAAAHLIKPEHTELYRQGKDEIIFKSTAPRYSYFSVGFQRI